MSCDSAFRGWSVAVESTASPVSVCSAPRRLETWFFHPEDAAGTEGSFSCSHLRLSLRVRALRGRLPPILALEPERCNLLISLKQKVRPLAYPSYDVQPRSARLGAHDPVLGVEDVPRRRRLVADRIFEDTVGVHKVLAADLDLGEERQRLDA